MNHRASWCMNSFFPSLHTNRCFFCASCSFYPRAFPFVEHFLILTIEKGVVWIRKFTVHRKHQNDLEADWFLFASLFAVVNTSNPTNEAELQLYRVLQRASLLAYYDTLLEMGKWDINIRIKRKSHQTFDFRWWWCATALRCWRGRVSRNHGLSWNGFEAFARSKASESAPRMDDESFALPISCASKQWNPSTDPFQSRTRKHIATVTATEIDEWQLQQHRSEFFESARWLNSHLIISRLL